MKKVLVNYGGILFFYLVIVLGILFLSFDNEYLHREVSNSSVSVINK